MMSDYTYGKDIRIYNLKEMLIKKYNYFKQNYLKTRKKIENVNFIFESLQTVTQIMCLIFAIIILVIHTENDIEGISNFIIYYQAILAFEPLIRQLFSDIAHIYKQNLFISDFRKFLNVYSGSSTIYQIEKKANKGNISIQNLYYRYSNTEKDTLKGITLDINYGEKIGIVGKNGAGKTTLIKTILKLYNV